MIPINFESIDIINQDASQVIFKSDDKEIRIKPPVQDLSNLSNYKKVFENDRFVRFTAEGLCKYDIFVTRSLEEHEEHQPFSEHKLESYDNYINNVYPKIKDQDLQWMHNILNSQSEQDYVAFSNDEFVLLPGSDNDFENNHNFHYIAIVRNTSLRSLRDLTSDHIGLLTSIYNNGINILSELLSLKESEIEVTVHYPPSCWLLHVHFNHKNSVPSKRTRSLLEIIENLKLVNNYYQLVSLEVFV